MKVEFIGICVFYPTLNITGNGTVGTLYALVCLSCARDVGFGLVCF